ncbi:class I SAM-dependent methyltransferase [Photobacterium sagamiensis]|uniref:class I SAM-dependent methyltransferase n=1 Tax=Photobacterium sagamiensis TaxID=2910241 RepID=UPI003D103D6B
MAIIDWLNYLSATKLLSPRPHVIEAHQFLGGNSHNKIAVDCGCGTGRDTLFLLEKGYQVYAFDKNFQSLEKLAQHPLAASSPKLDIKLSTFDEYPFPKAHLINASACLFYSSRSEFTTLWRNISDTLLNNGIFCGHFLGSDENIENEQTKILTHNKNELEQLLSPFYIISWKEKRELSAQLTGNQHLWKVHTIIAIKK